MSFCSVQRGPQNGPCGWVRARRRRVGDQWHPIFVIPLWAGPRTSLDTKPASVTPDLSVILPCYRSAILATRSVERLCHFLPTTNLSWEVVVVDDGGGDFSTSEWSDTGQVRLIRFDRNRGKGAAVGAGMLAATGFVRVYTDVDLPYDLELLPVMAEYIGRRGFHVVIGDRTLPGASYLADIGFQRRVASAIYSEFVGRLVTGGFFDTQCGLKAMRGDVANALFSLRRVDRFAFDVEMIYLALKHRLDIKRIPVQLRNNETSTVRLFRDSARGFADIFRIKYFQMRGLYASSVAEQIIGMDYDSVRAAVLGRGGSPRLGAESASAHVVSSVPEGR